MLTFLVLLFAADPQYVAGGTPPVAPAAVSPKLLPTSCFLTGCGCGCLDGKGCICRTPSHLRGVTYAEWKARLRPAPAVIVPTMQYRAAPAYNFMPAMTVGAACRSGG